jgi:hypothetical protein
VNIIETTPSAVFPFDRVGKALKHQRPVSFRAGKPVSRRFERYSGEPERGAVSGSESRSKGVALSARVGDRADRTTGQASESVPVRFDGV